jgi:anaerobic magnesium-protoporphyrin IX monomethyl ester cyclase
MRIALVTCPQYGVLHPPLSLAYLTAALRSRGHTVMPLDLSIQLFNELTEEERDAYWDINRPDRWWSEVSIKNIIKEERIDSWARAILQMNPDIVGFSVYTTNLLTSLMLAEKIKAKNDRIKIIFGGPFARRDNGIAGSIINYAYVDAVVVGEGEMALQEMVDSYEKNGKFAFCSGTMIKIDDKIVDGGIRPSIQSLDDLSFPDFSDFNFGIYKERLMPMLASRGCPHNCAFCNEKSFWQDYRWRTADNIIRELKQQISNYRISTFRFNDLLLNGNLGELEKFCDKIIQDRIKIKWSGYITVRKMTDELIVKMKNSGCYFIFVGIESGSQGILNKFKKGIKIEIAEELLQSFTRAGISTHTGWIVGFPDESFADFKQTIDFIKRNEKYISRVAPASQLTIPPGSLMAKYPSMFGVKRIIHEGEYEDSLTTLKLRQTRLNYFNKYISYNERSTRQ